MKQDQVLASMRRAAQDFGKHVKLMRVAKEQDNTGIRVSTSDSLNTLTKKVTELASSVEKVSGDVSTRLGLLERGLRGSPDGSDSEAREEEEAEVKKVEIDVSTNPWRQLERESTAKERREPEELDTQCRVWEASVREEEITQATRGAKAAQKVPPISDGHDSAGRRTVEPKQLKLSGLSAKSRSLSSSLRSSLAQSPLASLIAEAASSASLQDTPAWRDTPANTVSPDPLSERPSADPAASKPRTSPKKRDRSGESVRVRQEDVAFVVEGQAALRGQVEQVQREQRAMRELLLQVLAAVQQQQQPTAAPAPASNQNLELLQRLQATAPSAGTEPATTTSRLSSLDTGKSLAGSDYDPHTPPELSAREPTEAGDSGRDSNADQQP